MFGGEGEVVWCLAEKERWCGVWWRGGCGLVFSGKGELVWSLAKRERWCGV